RERAVLQPEALVGEQRGQLVELRSRGRGVGLHVVDRLDQQQRRVLLVVLRLTDLAGDGVALAQVVLAHVRERDVDIVGAGKVAVGPQEPVALGQDVEDPRAARCGLDLLDPIRLFANAALLALTPALLAGRTAAAIAIGSVAILVAAVLWPPVGVAVLWP